MTRAIRLSPCLLDGSLAYLASGDATELGFLVDALPSALDSDLHRSVRGEATSAHIWPAFASTTAGDVHDLLEEAILRSGCDAVVQPIASLAPALPCGCGLHCAVEDVCGACLAGDPVAVVDDVRLCDACISASREAMCSADTMPPPSDDGYALDLALLEVLP